ncbi:hypothetical protein Tco_0806643 [Tanacetum coccineum]
MNSMKELSKRGMNFKPLSLADSFPHENETLTEAWLRMKKCSEIAMGKTVAFADEGSSTSDTDKIMARMDAMTMIMDAHYKEFKSRSKQPNPDHNDDDTPMSREEEVKFMQTFRPRILNLRLANMQYGFPSGSILANTSTLPIKVAHPNLINHHKLEMSRRFRCSSRRRKRNTYSIEGTILEEKLFAEFDNFMGMTADENSESESDTEESPFENITFNTDYMIKTSLEEPPKNLELKPLPDNLEYAFLEEPSFLPVIISSQLSVENKNKLVSVLKRHKQAFA